MFDQQVGDVDETYTATPSLLTLKTLLALAVARGWHISLHLSMVISGSFHRLSTTLKGEPIWLQHFRPKASNA